MSLSRLVAFMPTAGGAVTLGAVVWLGCILPGAPTGFDNPWGFAPEGNAAAVLDTGSWPRSAAGFSSAIRAALLLAWGAWLLLVVTARSGGFWLERRVLWLLAIGSPLVVMLAMPPVLSRDPLGYVAYGRVVGLYGLNPYLAGGDALAQVGDPTARYLVWNTPLPYGPLWVLMAGAIASLAAPIGLWLEVLLHKAVASMSLLGGALAASRLAGADPDSDQAAKVAMMALNPLLLVEGAGIGHNDLIMSALILWAAVCSTRRRHGLAALSLGLAAAIKPVALAALPLLLLERLTRGEFARAAASGVIALAPTVILSFSFGGPGLLATALLERATAGRDVTTMTVAVLALGAGLSVWWVVARSARASGPTWLQAWIPLAMAIALVGLPVRFPWYLTWAVMPALALNREALPWWATPPLVISVTLMWQYSVQV